MKIDGVEFPGISRVRPVRHDTGEKMMGLPKTWECVCGWWGDLVVYGSAAEMKEAARFHAANCPEAR